MHVARTGDNRILDLFRQGLIKGTVTGGQGNEGLIVPLALLADKATDVISFFAPRLWRPPRAGAAISATTSISILPTPAARPSPRGTSTTATLPRSRCP